MLLIFILFGIYCNNDLFGPSSNASIFRLCWGCLELDIYIICRIHFKVDNVYSESF